ncbi:MAG: hypothetical protein L3J41_10270 [Melioribacteraceae bacterium]|nr:hypothetical protein [Melioribacteraceae bacterium]
MKRKTTFLKYIVVLFTLFVISNVNAQVTAPNGTENWEEGTVGQNITWNTGGYSGNVDIHYSTDNGGTWNLIVLNTINDGTEAWLIPNTLSINALVRVQDTGGAGFIDQSDAVFTIAGINAVTSPNGGENWEGGSSQTITWSTIGTVTNSTIEYFDGSGWTTLTTTGSGNSYTWNPVNNTPTTSALVRVTNSAGASTDQSDASFTISGINAVTSPNGGENWEEGSSQTITWTTVGTVVNSTIEYFNGSGWTTLTTTASGNSYTWNPVNNTPTTAALVRVTNTAGASTDQSDATFTIAGINAVTSPNGGENWEEGSSQNITWSTFGTVANSTIEYFNGSGWTTLTTTASGNSYTWNPVNNTPTTIALVRVTNTAGASTDQSDATFTIAGINAVTAPNGGEFWLVGASENITWSTIGTVINSTIEYYHGSGWTTLTTTASGNSYTWNPIPATPTTNALVRISNSAGSSIDQSDAVFTIHQPKLGIPTLTAPIDQATLVLPTPTFTWTQHLDLTFIFEDDQFYELIISTDQWFSTVIYTNISIATSGASTSFDLGTTATSLLLNTKYYWKVRSKRTDVVPTIYSPWSATFTFTTTPAVVVPTQTFPLSGTVYTNTPTFYWFTGVVSASQFFEVWYGVSGTVVAPVDQSAVGTSGSVGGTLVPGGTVGTSINYTIPGGSALISNTNYEWWVRSTDGTNRSDWSSMASFLTSSTNGGPVTPVGTYPTLGEDQYTNNPYLYWYIVTQVTGLQFEVVYGTDNTTPSSATPVPVMTGDQQHVAFGTVGTNYFYQLSGLVSSTTYYWWVRSTDGVNYSSWSPIYTFSTTSSTGSPVKPVLTYPANSETVYFPDVSLHWYVTTIATDLKYNLEWGTNTTRAGNTGTPQTGLTN